MRLACLPGREQRLVNGVLVMGILMMEAQRAVPQILGAEETHLCVTKTLNDETK